MLYLVGAKKALHEHDELMPSLTSAAMTPILARTEDRAVPDHDADGRQNRGLRAFIRRPRELPLTPPNG